MQFTNTQKVLNDFGKYLVEEYKDALILNNVNASDNLYNSVRYILETNDKSISVSLNLADYYIYVENGRRAGKMPPIDKIERWIEVKPVLPTPSNNGRIPTVRQLAYLISRKIGLEGIKPKPLLQQSITNVWDVFEEYISEAITKDVENNINEIIITLIK